MEQEISKAYSISNEYESEEFPASYQKYLLQDVKHHDAFVLESLQKIYHSGRLRGTKLLDFGSGPTIHRIASASFQFSDITLAEWSEVNRKELQKWLRGDSDALDWTPSLEICARGEGYRDLDKGVAEIEERIRKAVKKVIPCDILSEDILPDETEEFDAINLCYVLEVCCLTSDMYKEAVKKLTKYLAKGGALVMATVLKGEVYNVHKPLPCLYLTEDIIKEALIDAGLQLKDWFIWRDTSTYETFKLGGKAVHYSVKV